MARGRPVKSEVRQRIVEILHYMEKGYGYKIGKVYLELFPKISLRLIYYHLAKGVATKELEINEIKEEKGDYSWGQKTEKIYYVLGPNAEVKGNSRVAKFFGKRK